MIILGVSLLPILSKCPAHHSLATLSVLIMSGDCKAGTVSDCASFFFVLHWAIYFT